MIESPTTRIIAESNNEVVAKDERGRWLRMRRLSALDRLRLFKAIGPDLAQNAPYLGMAMLAYSVSAINDVPVPAPVTERQLESLVQQLGDEGLGAVADALVDDTEAATGPDMPGNSAGTPI